MRRVLTCWSSGSFSPDKKLETVPLITIVVYAAVWIRRKFTAIFHWSPLARLWDYSSNEQVRAAADGPARRAACYRGDAYCDKVDKIVGRTYPNFLIRQLRISLDLFVRLIRCQLVTDAQWDGRISSTALAERCAVKQERAEALLNGRSSIV